MSTTSTNKILIVDDNPTNQIVAQSILAQLGVASLSVSDGQEAVDICSKTDFDLILMDLQMPQMDGYQASRQLRQLGIKAPILALTANADITEVQHCYSAGMDGVLTKPITMDDMRLALDEYLVQDTIVKTEVLDKLAEKIGPGACGKVLQSYLTTLKDLGSQIEVASQQSDLKQLQRLGHKYSTSSATVGALKLAEIFKLIETLETKTEASVIVSQVPSLLRRTRLSLEIYLENSASTNKSVL